ncbi:MAG: L-fucose:H+ symporter permease [Prevotellaceae bacterium]|nr:L-fucose:H+ symporter permease [Prevotellaceae bacterium]
MGKVIEKKYVIPFILITSLFLLWGLANNMTDTLLAAFKRIMSMSDAQTSLIQFAFYGSYFCFALPAALYIKKFSYKSGVILGLILYASGAMLFYPASQTASYAFYLIAIYILAGGCSILETTANPYILSMGSPETATRRLNIAQAFNPLGSITGILLSMFFILGELSSANADDRAAMSTQQLEAMQAHELSAVTNTYMAVGAVLIVVLICMLIAKMPTGGDTDHSLHLKSTFKRLLANKKYSYGVIAQFFYVGAQIGVWSFTIRIVMQETNVIQDIQQFCQGIFSADTFSHVASTAEQTGASLYLCSIICFSLARFIFTWLMKYVRPSKLLTYAAVGDIICTIVVVLTGGSGWLLVAFLIGISFFMSLMFPTIYGIALNGLGDDAKIGASGLIMAILGGALITPLQGQVSDIFGINIAYLVPLVCFIAVLAYGIYIVKLENKALLSHTEK